MDYKEKYEQALLRAKNLHKDAVDMGENQTAKLCEIVFPELAESEDEKIRKRIIHALHGDVLDMEETNKALTWLEKQGGIDNCPLECSTNTVMTDSKKNQVKPKFKVGDWINGYYTNYKVLSVNNKGYVVEDVYGNKINILFENEKFHHLWTIQDAKDGDVLAGKIDGDNYILIFKQVKDGWVETYGHYYDSVDRFCVPSQLFCRDYQGTFIPATKEKCDLLFQKMKEAGYEWDDEHKRLLSLPLKDTKRKDMSQQIKLKEPDVYEYELERIVDKLNEVIGKLGDIYEVLSKPYVFPYRDYTPPSSIPGMDVWYTTHGVEKIPPVICETLSSIETDNGKDNDKERTN